MQTRTARRIHTYGGVFGALFLLIAGITGAVLTFRSSMRQEAVRVPDHLQSQPTMDRIQILKKAEKKMGKRASLVRFSGSKAKPHLIRFRNKERTSLYYAPSGDFLERRDRPTWSFVRFMFDLHTGAIAGRIGEIIMAVIGVILGASCITGLLIWPYLLKIRRRRQRSKLTQSAGSTDSD